MSLINDALKRAKAAQQATAHGPALHFRPVEVPAQTRRSFGLPQVAIVGLLLLIGLLVLKSI
ncbi:MAG TPA: hypothetical protein VLT36_10085, partial [Candidatus Dormibacteraeota bacterium]|nr:hypothetical protein [Candidatus Dormibacteraeota bacterium]